MKSTTTQALYATLLIQAKLASALVDSATTVPLVGWNFVQSQCFSGALEVYEGKILTANNKLQPVKTKVELIVQLEKNCTRILDRVPDIDSERHFIVCWD